MRTYPIRDEAGITFAFEALALLFGRRFARKLETIDGVSNVRPRRRWVGLPDVHIQFSYRGRECIAWEPYGDSSRWWIGPENTEPPHWDLSELEKAVARFSWW